MHFAKKKTKKKNLECIPCAECIIYDREAVPSGFNHEQDSYTWFPSLLLIAVIKTMDKGYFQRKKAYFSLQFIYR